MIIVKVGGGKAINWEHISTDLKNILPSQQVILVHGASETRDEIATKLGSPTKTVVSSSGISSVYTDDKAIDIFLMGYAGLVNKRIVETLQSYEINAIGLTGVDGRLWEAKAKPNIVIKENGKTKLLRDNKTGRVEKVNIKLLNLLLENNYVPVVSAPAISDENQIVNTDNDWATAVMAGQLGVKEVIYLFEAPGLMKDIKAESSKLKAIKRDQLRGVMKFAEGRMKKKLLGAEKALELGVKKVYFGDGRVESPITKALKGKGTIII